MFSVELHADCFDDRRPADNIFFNKTTKRLRGGIYIRLEPGLNELVLICPFSQGRSRRLRNLLDNSAWCLGGREQSNGLLLWLSVHAQRAIAVLVTGIAIGVPLFRFLPVFYQWVMRRRLIHWYGKLKALEASFDTDLSDKYLPEKKIEIERIEDAVSHIRLPLTFADQLYNLRSHIDIVRRKITSRTPGSMAAE